jgi:hypothetical protein
MKSIDWKLVENASENGIESLNEKDVQTLWRFIISFDDKDVAHVLNQAINEGIENLSPQASRLLSKIKNDYSIAEEQVSVTERDSVIDEDGNVLYDNTKGNEMTLSEMFGVDKKPVSKSNKPKGPVQDTVYAEDGTAYPDLEFEDVKRAPSDSSYMEKGMSRIKDFLK